MLNKVKLGMLVGFALQAARFFLPDLDIPEGLTDALVLVAVFVAQFFVRETKATVGDLNFAK